MSENQTPETPVPELIPELKPEDIYYVSDIVRSQQERVESLKQLIDDFAAHHRIGHTCLVFETEFDGVPRLGLIVNTELQELVGKSGSLRVEELLVLALMSLANSGLPKMEAGYEAGYQNLKERIAAEERGE